MVAGCNRITLPTSILTQRWILLGGVAYDIDELLASLGSEGEWVVSVALHQGGLGYWGSGWVPLDVLVEENFSGREERASETIHRLSGDEVPIFEQRRNKVRFTEIGYRVAVRLKEALKEDPLPDPIREGDHEILVDARPSDRGRGERNRSMQAYAEEVGGTFHQGMNRCSFCNHHNEYFVKRGGGLLCQRCYGRC